MKASNLTWEQIKELAEMAITNKCDFSLDITDGDMNVCITHTDDPKYSRITLSPGDLVTPLDYQPYATWINNASNYTVSVGDMNVDGSKLEW